MEWKSIDLSHELIPSLICVGNVNYYKSVHRHVDKRGGGEDSPLPDLNKSSLP